MFKVPFKLPVRHVYTAGGATTAADVDTGGYDFMIGGLGFRQEASKEFPYIRATEPTTTNKFDNSAEPGEHSLSQLPWIKAQASFHAGSGQLNLDQALSQFQFEQAQVAHLRYDTSQLVDPWTPGVVSRLPDSQFSSFGFTSTSCAAATVGGIDYAIVGGAGNLYQIKWTSGVDSAPTVTAIDLTNTLYGGASNCNITSITTDGANYYAVLQLTVVGSDANVLTYIVSNPVTSTASPTPLYRVPKATSLIARTNLCTNPNFETSTANWAGSGTPVPTLSQSAVQAHSGTKSLLITSTGDSSFLPNAQTTMTTVIGTSYTISCYVYIPTTNKVASATIFVSGLGLTSATSLNDQWVRLNMTFTATATSHNVGVIITNTGAGKLCYVDDFLAEASPSLNAYFDGSTAGDANYTYSWTGTTNLSTSLATPISSIAQSSGIVGWVKERLIAGLSNSVYELPLTPASFPGTLPSPKYTHPVNAYLWSSVGESPEAILMSGNSGLQSSILKFTLDTTGGTPTLAGGGTIAQLPLGEQVISMQSYLGTTLAIGTNKGIRIATFDTYTGALKYGPLSVKTTADVKALAGRDRFIYAGYTNQQPDGKTGLVRIDLSQPIDQAGRLAWAPDLKPPTTAPTGLGAVTAVTILPFSGRVMYLTPEGIHVEGNGPGNNGLAWLRTSRIRHDTAEPKLFKLGRIHGSLASATIQVTGVTPYNSDVNLGTFGFLSSIDPGPFRLPTGLNEWLQLTFTLQGAVCQLNSYQVKSFPAPARQHIIEVTAKCFRQEQDRYGNESADALTPRERYEAVKAMEAAGDEVRFVEFTNAGPVAERVLIDQIDFKSFAPPGLEDDFGGFITFKIRTTES